MGTSRILDVGLRIMLCRWRRIEDWSSAIISTPIWRFYCNPTPGAVIQWGEEQIELTPDRWALLPPDSPCTPASTKPFEHFFIHFTLGPDYRMRSPRCVTGAVDGFLRARLAPLVDRTRRNLSATHRDSLRAHQAVLYALSSVPADAWHEPVTDDRIRRVIEIIQRHLHAPLSVAALARAVDMHPNSLSRLFTREVGVPPHRYALRLRLDRACEQLIRENVPVETVAATWGFSDRYYLTRLMARHCSTTPGRLRRGTR